MKDQNIICFAKDFDEAPTSNHHVMAELARDNRVLWLDSVATRRPSLKSGRDLGKLWRKAGRFLRGPRQVAGGMWRFTPLVLPLPHSPVAAAVNLRLLRATLWILRKRLGMDRFQLWTFLPNVADYAGKLGESLLVYYCVDEWSLFRAVDHDRMVEADRRLCRRADVVFATAAALVEARRPHSRATYLAPHGVDHALFARALDRLLPLPEDVARLDKPLLGFYGTLEDWVDQRLLCYLAGRHPEWNIVLIGRELCDVSALRRLRNVHLLGARPHQRLPDYCRAFSVGLIPYVLSERMRFVNPVKLREYLSAGLSVVSTALPEVARLGALGCAVAGDHAEFEAAVVRALAEDSPERRRARSEAMRGETWSRRVHDVASQVTRAMEERS